MDALRLACIIEGKGEKEAVPALLRRLGRERPLQSPLLVQVLHPIVRSRGELLRAGGLERDVELLARRVAGNGGVFIIIDADDDCPATLGPELVARARQARSDVPIGLVLARSEFETWFIAAAESLRSVRGLPADLELPLRNVEEIRGAKEWLRERSRYNPKADQAALTETFDLALAQQRSPSFDKCIREFQTLVQALVPPTV